MQLSQAELNRCEEFLTSFNQIEQQLRQNLKENERADFYKLVTRYIDQHRTWQSDRQKLFNFASLRNALVHQREQPYQYSAVPTEETLITIRRFRDRLINPRKAIPTFKGEVKTLEPSQSLAWVFQQINECDYSQFPVYEGDRFLGLLTENGITRWLAHHTATQLTLVECADISIRNLLSEEEPRSNYKFLSRDALVEQVIEHFSDNPLLEAVLITHNGSPSEKLLGIATRWDVLQQIHKR